MKTHPDAIGTMVRFLVCVANRVHTVLSSQFASVTRF